MSEMRVHPLKFFSLWKWIDGRPLLDVIEPYRANIFERALFSFDETGRPKYNLVVSGRAKKNWKSADLIFAAKYKLFAGDSPGGNQCYILANDEDQAGDDLELAKKFIAANPDLAAEVIVKQKIIERRDGKGFLEILPAGDVIGSHGKTYCFAGFDEIHGYKNWDIFEALALDPSRPDSMQWVTSYASIYHRPGVPLFDLTSNGKKNLDARMFFSWYAADYTTDAALAEASPEDRANPSRSSWGDDGYLEQQRTRLPSHKFRRLHLNLPGSPEGSAFNAERVMEAVDRGVKARLPVEGIEYTGFVDMSGGSNDDACLAIAHQEGIDPLLGRAVLDCVMNQGPTPPFNPLDAVGRFAEVLRQYHCSTVTGDRYAGETFRAAFEACHIRYVISELTKSQIYEAVEARLNSLNIVLLDQSKLESEFLGLVWRGGRIDHPSGEHDDWANAAAGALNCTLTPVETCELCLSQYGEVRPLHRGGCDHSDDLKCCSGCHAL